MTDEKLYQSILKKLSTIPPSRLEKIDHYLATILDQAKSNQVKAAKIMSFAGSWSDMDFDNFLEITKNTRANLFNRPVE